MICVKHYQIDGIAVFWVAQPAYCIITDISDGGVRIYLNGLEVPDEFVLLLSGDGPAMDGRYRVVWREGDEVGAKYVS